MYITRIDVVYVDDFVYRFWDESWVEAVPDAIGDGGTKSVVVVVKTVL